MGEDVAEDPPQPARELRLRPAAKAQTVAAGLKERLLGEVRRIELRLQRAVDLEARQEKEPASISLQQAPVRIKRAWSQRLGKPPLETPAGWPGDHACRLLQ